MAVDTRNKRASAIGIGLALRLVLPAPDASVDQPDRQQVSYSYAGISAQALSVLDLCATTVRSLMPVRTVVSLMSVRSVSAYCDHED